MTSRNVRYYAKYLSQGMWPEWWYWDVVVKPSDGHPLGRFWSSRAMMADFIFAEEDGKTTLVKNRYLIGGGAYLISPQDKAAALPIPKDWTGRNGCPPQLTELERVGRIVEKLL